jgi:hypothetical protein
MISKVLIFLFILISSNTYSQVIKIFYVDDVETIDYVTVKFCVNDSARINEVTVIPELTTYKNQNLINELITYLKSVQYYPDSKLRNNCYPSTFQFINRKYENSKLDESNYAACKKFKRGEFEYLNVLYRDTKIKRKKKIQTENSKDFNAKYKIKWTKPDQYEMTYIKVKEKENQNLIGKTIIVKIIGILENNYIYSAEFQGNPTTIGEMKKVK